MHIMMAHVCHHLSDYYVDLSDLYVVLSDLYVDLSELYVVLSDLFVVLSDRYVDLSDFNIDLSLIHLLENISTETYNRLVLLCYASKWQNKIRVIF